MLRRFGEGALVDRKPVRHSTGTSHMGTVSEGATPKQSKNGAWAVAAIIGFLIILGKCSSSQSTYATPEAEQVGNAQQALVSAVSEQTPAPVEEFSPTSTSRGSKRVALAAAEGLSGEMIYSQNCYDVVGRGFSWRKLDECGGFDAEAGLTLGDTEPIGAEKEVAWFDSEAAAGRFLKAAVAAGLDADAADQRWAALQRRVGIGHKAPRQSDLIARP